MMIRAAYMDKRPDDPVDEVGLLRQQLAEAAREINCAGSIAERIRVLKSRWEYENGSLS